MDTFSKISDIKSKKDFIDFINYLSIDKRENNDEWESNTIEDYLESVCSWVEDMEGYYENNNLPVPNNENWSFIATLFYVGKIYE